MTNGGEKDLLNGVTFYKESLYLKSIISHIFPENLVSMTCVSRKCGKHRQKWHVSMEYMDFATITIGLMDAGFWNGHSMKFLHGASRIFHSVSAGQMKTGRESGMVAAIRYFLSRNTVMKMTSIILIA